MKPSPIPLRLGETALEIFNPPRSGSGPLPYSICDPNGCKIKANGRVIDPAATHINSVRGWVNSEANAGAGSASGLTWEITVGKAVSGATNTFCVEVEYSTSGGPVVIPGSRQFIATGYSGSCSGVLLAMSPQRPVARLMSRYYKVTADPQALPSAGQGPSPFLAEQLGQTGVYLAYDVALSTPGEPVWRDINLPPSAGHWTLRVRRTGGGLSGELVLQRLSETEVHSPVVLSCPSWTFAGKNVLAEASAAAEAAPKGAPQAAVVVEPA